MRFLILAIFCIAHVYGISQNCSNENFESTTPGTYTNASAVSGWTVTGQDTTVCTKTFWKPGSSKFKISATPISNVPGIGTLGNSPIGGTVVAVLNSTVASGHATRLTKTISVTSSNPFLNYAFAFVFLTADHGSCCWNQRCEITIKGPQGTVDPCLSRTITSVSNCNSGNTYSLDAFTGYGWSSWQTVALNLSAYTGSVITLEVSAFDCNINGHWGQLFFDAECSSSPLASVITSADNTSHVNWCAGTNTAIITAPPGMASYTWTSPTGTLSASVASQSLLSISSPSVGNVYTVAMTSNAGCFSAQAYTLVYTNVASGPYVTSVACGTTATGSATIFPSGSGVSYSVTWSNFSSSVVATGTAVSNLPSGYYLAHISALNAAGCGTASASVYIPNFSYTSSFSPTSVSVCRGDSLSVENIVSGNSSSYTFSWSPATFLNSTNSQSVIFAPSIPPGGSVSVTYSVLITPTAATHCANTNTLLLLAGDPPQAAVLPIGIMCQRDGTIQLQASPLGGIFSGGGPGQIGNVLDPILNPPGNYILNYSTTVAGCTRTASTSFNVLASPTIAVTGNTLLCQGQTMTLVANGAISYTWANFGTTASIMTTPQVGSTYWVVGTNTTNACVHQVSVAPVVAPVPTLNTTSPASLCVGQSGTINSSGADNYSWIQKNVNTYSLVVTPVAGVNTYSVLGTNTLANCSSMRITTVIGIPLPTITITTPTVVCKGDKLTLFASGANQFVWHDNSPGATYTTTAAIGVYSVTGTNEGLCFGSASVFIDLAECLGLEEKSLDNGMIYPNPSNGFVYCYGFAGETLNVIDARGSALISRVLVNDFEKIELTVLPAGIYCFKIGKSSRTVILVAE